MLPAPIIFDTSVLFDFGKPHTICYLLSTPLFINSTVEQPARSPCCLCCCFYVLLVGGLPCLELLFAFLLFLSVCWLSDPFCCCFWWSAVSSTILFNTIKHRTYFFANNTVKQLSDLVPVVYVVVWYFDTTATHFNILIGAPIS